jgi:hypothetical protein
MELLTRKEALTRCRDHWLWVAKTGKSKSDYPFKGVMPAFDCYACEYDLQHHDRPLSGLSRQTFCGKACIVPWPGGGCNADESPFVVYARSEQGSDKRKQAALAIAALCEKALNELQSQLY